MNGLGVTAAIISAVVIVVGFAGTVVVFLNGSKDKGSIATLKTYSETLEKRVAQLEAADAEHLITEAGLKERLASVERENVSLAAQRPSAEAIAALTELVDQQGALLAKHDSQTLALLRKVTG